MCADQVSPGINYDELDPEVRPQDDLFRHVNGRWIDRTEIPADKARYGSFYALAEEAEEAVRTIIAEAASAPAGSEEKKFGDLFASFMDEARADELGARPLQPQLDLIDVIVTHEEFASTLGRLDRLGFPGLLQLFVDNDPGNPERYLVFVEQGGLGLPDESYYREDKFAEVRDKYRAFIATLFGLAGIDDADGRAQKVFALESRIAALHWDNVASRDSEATYNLMNFSELTAGPGELLEVWRSAVGAPEGSLDEVVVRQPSFVAGASELLAGGDVDTWKDWLRFQVIRGSAAYLSSDFVEANFDFYGRTLTGTPQLRERWKRGVSLVESCLGEAVGKIYVERHFSPTAKARMDVLVEHLVEAYRESITGLAWMTPATQQRALDKLDKFTPKIGFPDTWRDYSALTIVADDLMANIQATNEFEFVRELGKIGSPIDRDEWFMTPQTINAYYNPGFNEIVFPAAILQYPFFDETRDDAANFGAIGAVIGHEIGHGFDDQGSKYDGDGRLTDWWTAEDRQAFETLTAALIDQFDGLSPAQVPGHTVNGALTIGENIGDLGGLSIAWMAYERSREGKTTAEDAQRFFLSWAQAWQMKARDEEVIRLLAIDPHSPNEFRCNQIVRNIDAFYRAFDVQPTDALWLDPDKRVSIW